MRLAQGGTPRRGIGRSRVRRAIRPPDGLLIRLTQTTKIHLRCNGWGLPMRTDVTPGQTSDHKGFDLVMGDDLPAPCAPLADKGYDADRIRDWAGARDAIPVIPMRRNRNARAGIDQMLYTLRSLAERCFGRLKDTRREVTRYDKTAMSFIDIACIRLWTRRLVNTA